jgi:hypothetical protein
VIVHVLVAASANMWPHPEAYSLDFEDDVAFQEWLLSAAEVPNHLGGPHLLVEKEDA